jgi:hypothetical protein
MLQEVKAHEPEPLPPSAPGPGFRGSTRRLPRTVVPDSQARGAAHTGRPRAAGQEGSSSKSN